MAPIERAAEILDPRQFCSILFFYVFFYTLLGQNVFVITYSREELLYIRVVVTHQHYQYYDQVYDFPKSDTLFIPPRAIELIPEADPKHRRQRRGTQSGLLVRLRRCAPHPPLQSILLTNVQSG